MFYELLLSILPIVFTWFNGFSVNEPNNVYVILNEPQSSNLSASFLMFTANAELGEVLRTMRSVEDRFNKRFHYPWTFYGMDEFTEYFMSTTSTIASGHCEYVHWDLSQVKPLVENNRLYQQRADALAQENLSYVYSPLFHSFQDWVVRSLLYHPQLEYDYVWRIEPGLKLVCEEKKDIFATFKDSDIVFTNHVCERKHSGIYAMEEAIEEYKILNTQGDFSNIWVYSNNYTYCKYWPFNEILSLKQIRHNQTYTNLINYLLGLGGTYYHRWSK